jgi:uncharacterized protein
MNDLTAADIIKLLKMKPHPEGGYFVETWRDTYKVDGERAASSLIYYLLDTGQTSEWHRVDVWRRTNGSDSEPQRT